jgi:hypothetical protein
VHVQPLASRHHRLWWELRAILKYPAVIAVVDEGLSSLLAKVPHRWHPGQHGRPTETGAEIVPCPYE